MQVPTRATASLHRAVSCVSVRVSVPQINILSDVVLLLLLCLLCELL